MQLKKWEELPEFMKNDEVRKYYDTLLHKGGQLVIKRLFDFGISLGMILALSPVMAVLAIWIKADSKGPVFFKQVRVTQYGRKFKIYKFRTMVENAEQLGSQVTAQNDKRITKVGEKLRKVRLDELPQLFNILVGDMSFVGTRPEVPKYVKRYTKEMRATLLLPAGVTSEASIEFKDEDKILKENSNIDDIYIRKVLPQKMKYNLVCLKNFSLFNEFRIMVKTVAVVIK